MKIAVYTAVFGEKDKINSPINFDIENTVEIDWFCFTDSKSMYSDVYTIINVESSLNDIAKNARKFKILGFQGDDKYDYTIWHDGNITLDASKIGNLIKLSANSQLTLFKHSVRDCSYREVLACMGLKKDYSLRLFIHSLFLFYSGLGNNKGLFETGLYIKNINRRNKDFEEAWWKSVSKLSRRDQVSLPIHLIKFKINYSLFLDTIYTSKFCEIQEHAYSHYLSSSRARFFEFRLFQSISYRGVRLLIKINDWFKK